MSEIILAAQTWRDNAALIETARDLGYITGRVLDPTYGRGNWWRTWRPDGLVAHDIKLDGVDFRSLPAEGLFDTIAFDPPYIPQGGRTTSTLRDDAGGFLDRYGLHDVPGTNAELLELIVAGIGSFATVANRRAVLLVKCMSYVTGGRWRPMPRWVANAAEGIGWTQVDELVHVRPKSGPQPPHLRQLTARRNYSLLLVFRWPNAAPAAGRFIEGRCSMTCGQGERGRADQLGART